MGSNFHLIYIFHEFFKKFFFIIKDNLIYLKFSS